MDEFHVKAEDTSVLSSSHLVTELQEDSAELDSFPVLIGRNVSKFHSIAGGYDRDNGYHIVNLIHTVQGDGNPPSNHYAKNIELHLEDWAWLLEVDSVWTFGDYPEENFILSLKVTGYQQEPYSFAEQITTDIDKRHTEFDQ